MTDDRINEAHDAALYTFEGELNLNISPVSRQKDRLYEAFEAAWSAAERVLRGDGESS